MYSFAHKTTFIHSFILFQVDKRHGYFHVCNRAGAHTYKYIYIYIYLYKEEREEEEQIRSGIIRRGRHPESIIDIMRQKREREKGTGMLDKGRCALSNT
jgi:predicted ATPase